MLIYHISPRHGVRIVFFGQHWIKFFVILTTRNSCIDRLSRVTYIVGRLTVNHHQLRSMKLVI